MAKLKVTATDKFYREGAVQCQDNGEKFDQFLGDIKFDKAAHNYPQYMRDLPPYVTEEQAKALDMICNGWNWYLEISENGEVTFRFK